ncbi:MAG: SIS domain-containing protein [Alphaproteobacteria bacterium]|nr:SIS domain-containing protein [Alphaproteobacteria bacterium]
MSRGSTPATQLAAEWREAPDVLRRQCAALKRPLAGLVAVLRRAAPRLIVTCARGSSAHAATYGKHLFERHLGLPVAAAAPNIASVYHGALRLEGQLFLAISQSGRSEDLVATATMARRTGAITAALVNDCDSPLAAVCEHVLPLAAGPELSVAATKSFIASLGGLLRIAAAWSESATMAHALTGLPARVARATALDWSAASVALIPSLAAARSVMLIGRGPTLAIAREAALKLKEVCNIHAEAFSSAEFRHGPIALVEAAYPVLLFATTDETAESLRTLAHDLRHKGATVFATGRQDGDLPTLEPDQADADAIGQIQAFYGLLLRLAAQRGSDVDRPRHLHKVTTTR